MATSYVTGIDASGPAAGFRVWAGAIEALLLAGGWVKTSDTGQCVTSTLPAQIANTTAGYQIWRMADALDGTSPFYVKIEFGAGGQASFATLFCTIGTGSNGSGGITGIFIPRFQTSAASAGGAGSTFYGSANNNQFTMAMFHPGSLSNWGLSWEREKDSSGNPVANGFLQFYFWNTNVTMAQVNDAFARPSDAALLASSSVGAFVPSGTTWADGANVGVCPVRFPQGGPSNPCLSWLAYLNGDTAAGVSIPVSMYGVSRMYMPLGSARINTVASGNANSSLMMLWE